MFSGIIKELGFVNSININGKSGMLSVNAPNTMQSAYLGQSIAVNGVCLTVTKVGAAGIFFDFTPETYGSSALKFLKSGERVNIEPALSVNSDLSGHFVLGHVDGLGEVVSKKKLSNSFILEIAIPAIKGEIDSNIEKYITKKGSVSIDGISLTINEVWKSRFSVSIIPFTYNETNLRFKKKGDFVNLESDIIEKTVIGRIENILLHEEPGYNKRLSSGSLDLTDSNGKAVGITKEFLLENGFL